MDSFKEPFSYIEDIVATKKMIDNTDVSQLAEYTNIYHFITASYAKLLPELPKEEYFKFSKNVKFYQFWAGHDQEIFSLLGTTDIIDANDIIKKAQKNSYVFCTYHIGSYRILNSILGLNKIPFSLVTDKNYIETQGVATKAIFKRLNEEYLKRPDANELEILNAESSTIALQATRKLKSGTSLVFYIDGNTGVGGSLNNTNNLAKVNFCNNPISARKGVAFISHFTQTPIVPVICIRTGWLSRTMFFLDPIIPTEIENREEFCQIATQKLYNILEEYIKKYPEQWEGWMYIYKSLDIKENPPEIPNTKYDVTKPFILNEQKYALMKFGSKQCLFEKETLKVFDISNQFYEVLNHFKAPSLISELNLSFSVPSQSIEELAERGIITNTNI